MDHDDALLREQVVRLSRVDERGPIPEFLAKKDAEQAKQTCDGYRYALQRFLAFVGEEATVGDVTEATGHRFLRYLREEGLSENTIATYLRCLKAFTRWMHKKGWTERDRFADVKQPPFVRPKFDTLTPVEKQAILTALNPDTFLGARNLAILCVFLDTGIRREELVHLQEARVRLAEGYIEVYSQKTNEWRVIPLSSEAVAVCRNYLKWRDRFMARPVRRRADARDANRRLKQARSRTADTFFCTWLGGPLSESSVGWMVRRLRARLAEAGVNLRIHPHLFRHNFLTEKALDGENPSMVRRWAGHRKYEMTDYYFGLAEAKLAAIKPKQSTLAGLQILRKKTGRAGKTAPEATSGRSPG
ncbi:MAG: tyrosine-type recombinase/integrase [Chloroflexi bacterium]|nr:tyrosine-type recombinase/integrase [Chloroflexota bacterium]